MSNITETSWFLKQRKIFGIVLDMTFLGHPSFYFQKIKGEETISFQFII